MDAGKANAVHIAPAHWRDGSRRGAGAPRVREAGRMMASRSRRRPGTSPPESLWWLREVDQGYSVISGTGSQSRTQGGDVLQTPHPREFAPDRFPGLDLARRP